MSNCVDGRGIKQDHEAEGFLFSPEGKRVPGQGMCAQHAQECIKEYQEKLGEVWTFQPNETQDEPLSVFVESMQTQEGRQITLTHQSDTRSFEEDERGFYVPRCECGWKSGPVPDIETVCDALMEHATERALDREGQ